MRRLDVSNPLRDPPFNKGYAYIVEEVAYKNYLAEYGEKIEADPVSTCNSYNAIKMAESRGGKGIATSGIGAVDCIRHDMKRPVSVGSLQKGERYVSYEVFRLLASSY